MEYYVNNYLSFYERWDSDGIPTISESEVWGNNECATAGSHEFKCHRQQEARKEFCEGTTEVRISSDHVRRK